MPLPERARDGHCPELSGDSLNSGLSRPLTADSPPSTQPRCRHCRGDLGFSCRRGLCRRCRTDPKIRQAYPRLPAANGAGSPWSAWGSPDPLPPARRATDAAPGSAEKIAVLIARAAARVELFHPDDDGEPVAATVGLSEAVVGKTAGVYRVQKKTVRWRAYPVNPRARLGKGKRARPRIHLGYFATHEEAVAEVVAWQRAGCPADWKTVRTAVQAGERTRRADAWVAVAIRELATG
jgi:hypothetical protein